MSKFPKENRQSSILKLHSYVVDHDNGHAPNPYYGICTLAHCKFAKGKQRNVVELAQEGDWVVGTGGRSKKSAGHGKLIYAMRVDEKMTLAEYYPNRRFIKKRPKQNGTYRQQRGDNKYSFSSNKKRQVLISKHYFYFGKNAIYIPARFPDLEKRGPGHRSDFNAAFISRFARWIQKKYKPGMHGDPCGQRHIQMAELKKRQSCK